jgi:hypothetical protein
MCRHQQHRSGLFAIAAGATLCALAAREPDDTSGPQLARLAGRSLIAAVGGTIGVSIDRRAIDALGGDE